MTAHAQLPRSKGREHPVPAAGIWDGSSRCMARYDSAPGQSKITHQKAAWQLILQVWPEMTTDCCLGVGSQPRVGPQATWSVACSSEVLPYWRVQFLDSAPRGALKAHLAVVFELSLGPSEKAGTEHASSLVDGPLSPDHSPVSP